MYPPMLIRVGVSKILPGQVGLLATRLLPKNTKIGDPDLMGEEGFMTWEEFALVDGVTQNAMRDFCLQTEDGLHIPNDMNYLSLPWFMNHSCNGNVGFVARDNFITICDVAAGEELSLDFGIGFSYPEFRLNCLCGSPNCRRLVTGSDWRDPSVFLPKQAYMLSTLRDRLIAEGHLK